MTMNNVERIISMSDKIYIPTNPESQECVKNVMKYLSDISYDKIITGQHTQTMEQKELHKIKEITGKQPALLGFELLSYSPNINYADTDDVCMAEVIGNYGTLKRAWEWAEQKGIVTFTWHWFSPLGGRSKSFFTENTDFDASRALIEGSAENIALISDMDTMAGILRPFCDKGIPILWRPFHEGDGKWFWWGAKGAVTVKALYRLMYERYTKVHKLNNLIWVWSAAGAEFYPGDDVVDIISADIYPERHSHTSQSDLYSRVVDSTKLPKIATIGEIGSLPDIDAIHNEKIGWASYMTWSNIFCLTEEFNTYEYLKKLYESPYAITLDKLPKLY